MNKHIQNRTGFSQNGTTLVELLVATAIFSMATLIIIQTFASSLKIERSFLAKSQAMDESSYLMEHVSREIRMAKRDDTSICQNMYGYGGINFGRPDGPSSIGFKSYSGKCVKIYLNGTTLYESMDGIANPLTSPRIKVLAFNVADIGWDKDDNLQPRVTLYLKMQYGIQSPQTFEIQTSISQRDPDVH